MDFKVCSKCKATKPLEEFHRDKYKKSGLKNKCRACCVIKSIKCKKLIPSSKPCSKCGIEKHLTEFYHRENGKLRSACKKCTDKSNHQFFENNPEKLQNYRNSPKNIAQRKLWRIQNPEKHKESRIKAQVTYYTKNPEKACENSMGFLVSKTLAPSIIKRDSYKCQLCEVKGEVVHHIIPKSKAPDRVADPLNLITLCKKCHKIKAHMGCFRCLDIKIMEHLILIAAKNSKEIIND
jgi:5-methylcytosine-specific restriction endonuclease McrA